MPTVSQALVVGAGPAGLTMAAELARRDVSVRLIEKRAEPIATSNALAIQARTLEIFEQMGLIETVLRDGHRVHGLNIHAGERTIAHIDLASLESPYPYILVLPQAKTEQILAQHAQNLGVQIERQVELIAFTSDDAGVSATLRRADGTEEEARTAWLIGCDGAHSTVRRLLDAPFEGGDYEETFLFADLMVNWALRNDTVQLFFHPDGLLVMVPIAGELWRVIANVADTPDRTPPTLSEVEALVAARGPGGVELSKLVWGSRPRIHHRKVRHFRHGRVFLASDAAHVHSPAGGQGMNIGIQDAFDLAWKLALVTLRRSPASLLNSYDAEREPVARQVLSFPDTITRIATTHSPLLQAVRNQALSLLSGINLLVQRAASNNAELAVDYRSSPFVSEHWQDRVPDFLGAFPHAGERAPDGRLRDLVRGADTRLFELFRDLRHSLLLFTGPGAKAFDYQRLANFARVVEQRYAGLMAAHLIAFAMPPESSWNGSLLLDIDGRVHRRYDAIAPCLYLVRPDGYIAYRTLPPRPDFFEGYLAQVFLAQEPPSPGGPVDPLRNTRLT
jgi:2-polyprenyl-6-methoxyphenol hydroxylase-like FAD-dependent oxidoreductase